MRIGLALVLLIALLTALAVSCDFRGALPGDRAHDLYFTNGTDVPVFVYERYPGGTTSPNRVASGGTFRNQVIVPFVDDLATIRTPRRFEAMTEAGEIVYCRPITYRELDGLAWRVIVDRTLACP